MKLRKFIPILVSSLFISCCSFKAFEKIRADIPLKPHEKVHMYEIFFQDGKLYCKKRPYQFSEKGPVEGPSLLIEPDSEEFKNCERLRGFSREDQAYLESEILRVILNIQTSNHGLQN